ncbi:MAG: efflux RND transporter periplasmic adaptor subunit [Candidatus Aminicenantales bacterium]
MIFPKKVLAFVLALIIIGAASYFVFFKNKKGTEGAEGGGEAAQAAKAEEAAIYELVKVSPVKRGDLVIRLKSPGEAVTEKMIVMKTEVSGTIKNFSVKEGKHVRAGEVLIEIDDQEYRLKWERAEALRLKYLSDLLLDKQFAEPDKALDARAIERIRQAEQEFSKAGSLFGQGMVSREEFEKAKRTYETVLIESGIKKEEVMAASKGLTQAEIDTKIAQMEIEKTKIRAPFEGIITDIKVSPQENISAGRELFTLVNISQIKVQAKVLESEVGKMKVGHEAALRFSAYPGKVFKGHVEAISPVINPEDRTCTVHILVDNPEEEVKPGMHAEVEIAADIYKDRLLVPQEAVLVRGGRKLVFVVEEGLAKWRYIEIGQENEDYAEVLDGVKEGEPVIVEGHFTLAHDAKVQVAQ